MQTSRTRMLRRVLCPRTHVDGADREAPSVGSVALSLSPSRDPRGWVGSERWHNGQRTRPPSATATDVKYCVFVPPFLTTFPLGESRDGRACRVDRRTSMGRSLARSPHENLRSEKTCEFEIPRPFRIIFLRGIFVYFRHIDSSWMTTLLCRNFYRLKQIGCRPCCARLPLSSRSCPTTGCVHRKHCPRFHRQASPHTCA